MNKHWNPDGEAARWRGANPLARPKKTAWPEGATAGLLLVAACCLALGTMLYKAAGPRDVVDERVARR